MGFGGPTVEFEHDSIHGEARCRVHSAEGVGDGAVGQLYDAGDEARVNLIVVIVL